MGEVKEQLPQGSSRNKIEYLADVIDSMTTDVIDSMPTDVIDSMPTGNFKPVSMVLKPKRFDTYRGMKKDTFRLVSKPSFVSGPYEITENNGISVHQFTKDYEVEPPSPQNPGPIEPDVVVFQINVTFELLIKNLPDKYSDIEKLKGLKLRLFLNDSEEHDRQDVDIGFIPATLIKNKYSGIMIYGSANSVFTLDKPRKGAGSSNDKYLSCCLYWDETDFDFSSYSKDLMWKENAFELTNNNSQLGVRVSILDVHTEVPVIFGAGNRE